jgi:hypothetical protein
MSITHDREKSATPDVKEDLTAFPKGMWLLRRVHL